MTSDQKTIQNIVDETTIDDLVAIGRDSLESLMSRAKKAHARLETKERDDAKAAAEEAAAKFGFNLKDLVGGDTGKTGKKSGVPRFRNPAAPDQTWTGRGRKPAWIKEGLENGKSLDDFRI